MAALTSDRNTEYSLGDLLSIPVAMGSRIFAGALVCSNPDGYAVPAADTAGLTFQGVATAAADNRNGQDAAVRVVVRRRGRYRLDCASRLDQSALSALVYAVDEHTVAAAGDVDNDVLVGLVDRVESSDECWVSVDAAVLAGKSWTEPTSTTTTTQGA
jgi:hypothetical protein